MPNLNNELPNVQAGFIKGRGTWDQIANIHWIMEKARARKTCISALLTMPKPLTVYHNKLWKILKEMGIPDHLIYLLINLYACQEATVRTGHGKTDLFQIGKGLCQGCHPAYLTYVQIISREMLGWMKPKLESRMPEEMAITPDIQITPPLWQKVKRN